MVGIGNEKLSEKENKEIKEEIRNINIALRYLRKYKILDDYLRNVNIYNRTNIKNKSQLINFIIKKNREKNYIDRGKNFNPIKDLFWGVDTYEGGRFWRMVNSDYLKYYKHVTNREFAKKWVIKEQ